MLKKTIKYTDFNDEEVEEDFYFHLSKAELVELEMTHEGGMIETLKRIIASVDQPALIKEFKYILLLSYGQRSADGRRFVKNQALREEFESTEAYSVLFMELVTDENKAIEFFNGIVPADLTAEQARAVGIDPERTPIIELAKEPRIVTKAEMENMNQEELTSLSLDLANGVAKLAE